MKKLISVINILLILSLILGLIKINTNNIISLMSDYYMLATISINLIANIILFFSYDSISLTYISIALYYINSIISLIYCINIFVIDYRVYKLFGIYDYNSVDSSAFCIVNIVSGILISLHMYIYLNKKKVYL